jgi:succinyl-CoA:acetate CoA-transferase
MKFFPPAQIGRDCILYTKEREKRESTLNRLGRRIRNKELLKKVVLAEEVALLFRNNMLVATSGNSLMGYPKATFLALAERIKREGGIKIDLLAAGPLGPEVEEALVQAKGIGARIGAIGSGPLREAINHREVRFLEGKGGQLPVRVKQGAFGKVDAAVIEAIGITEEGNIIPATAIYDAPEWVEMASSLIVEINLLRPLEIEGIHDVYLRRPGRPIPLLNPLDRIGTPYIPTDSAKIKSIVISEIPDRETPQISSDGPSRKIGRNIVEFLKNEVRQGRLPHSLPPLEVGIGGIGSGIFQELSESEFNSFFFYMPAITDPVLDLIDCSKVRGVTGLALRFSAKGWKKFESDLEKYKKLTVLRPMSILNAAEIIQRFGVISINIGLEIDILGQVNSSHLMGSRVWGGVAGSYDFARNGAISIFAIPSTTKGGKISSIVPVVSHVDHTEHEVDVVVTEQGLADLRGLDPYERAQRIIEECAHPDYRDDLLDYLSKAKKELGHIPFSLEEAPSFHRRFRDKGNMREV